MSHDLPPVPDPDFHAHHAAPGAYFSFTLGKFARRGGFGLELGRPGDCDVYVGVKHGRRGDDTPLVCLPFFEGAGGDEAQRYEAGPNAGQRPDVVPTYDAGQITRRYGWATDCWETPDFTFRIGTGVHMLSDPAEDIKALLSDIDPAIPAVLDVDNRAGAGTKTAFFALDFNAPGTHVAAAADPLGEVGVLWRDRFALAGWAGADDRPDDAAAGFEAARVEGFQRFTLADGLREAVPHQLGNVAGLLLEVPAGTRRTLEVNLRAFRGGTVTTGLRTSYFYARGRADLRAHDGDGFAIEETTQPEDDAALLGSGLSPHQQFLIAHATRSYFGSTQLLDHGGRPFWVVNEGEYCMMNTLDLAVDQVFFELRQNPWVVRNLLESFARHYRYVDDVLDGGGTRPGGVSFTHDMGVHNNFSPEGHSSYELPGLTGCFSYMTLEELCNWVLIAGCYVAKTGDQDWRRHHAPLLEACLESLANRGGEVGFAQYDAARCAGGSEITTYDSLDPSLAQTRNNLYVAVKCWATYRLLAMLLPESRAGDLAELVARNLARETVNDDGTLPAVFEPDNPGHASRILPAVEGLIYPHYCGLDLVTNPAEAALHDALRRHTLACINDPQRRNHFPDGGVRLSSTSGNSWLSKIFLFQHVCRRVMGIGDELAAAYPDADAAHVNWLTRPESAYWAFSDQIIDGVARASLYYPRGVTNVLWLDEA